MSARDRLLHFAGDTPARPGPDVHRCAECGDRLEPGEGPYCGACGGAL